MIYSMDYPVINFFKKAISALSFDGLFLIVSGLIALSFAAFLIGAVKRKENENYSLCFYFSVASFSVITLACAIYLIAETPFYAFAFYFAFLSMETVLLSLVLKACMNKKKDLSEEKELIKYIDGEIKKEEKAENSRENKDENFSPRSMENETLSCKAVPENSVKNDGLNFSHVKSVLERLEYFDLSPADKKHIESLKSAMYVAERQGFTDDRIKGQINDGLSGLLKIMSRYGV